ncbi:hypothetical protein BKA70DRAFT_1400388 [Coprinopsis sp. MPI-PUGE-AT-0042]|nr:hypothetical protein BKA70DRAFT_1400388 [Coprinopsis sp. MPI-PUGE-AT-0042]
MASKAEIDPRVLPYTQNNDPLPATLKSTLDGHLEEGRARIAACDTHINEMERKIQALRQKIQALEQEVEGLQVELEGEMTTKRNHESWIRALTSTVSIVRRLPPEIVATIMKIAVGDIDLGHNREQRLLDLSAISKLWRSTALSTPSLWRSLRVELHRFSARRNRKQARLYLTRAVNQWLSRGGEGAEINMTVVGGRDVRLELWDLINWIRTSSFAFVSLAFHGVFPIFQHLQALFTRPAPSLNSVQRLTIDLPRLRWLGNPESPRSIDANSTLPNLDHLIISVNNDKKLSVFFIHATLTKLEISVVTLHIGDVLKLMGGFPSLQSLLLEFCSMEEDDGWEVPWPLTHHSMRTISLHDALHGQLFNGISCPRLERLELTSTPRYGGPDPEGLNRASALAFGDFLKRSNASNLALHLDTQFPSIFLNDLLSTSSPCVTALCLKSPASLPLDSNNNATRLVIPFSLSSIRCAEVMSEEEATLWMGKLASCMEDASNSTLSVTFGEGKTVNTRHVNEV